VNKFSGKLVFISGKGGVGKSVVAASLARVNAKKGIKTALIELSFEPILSRLFSTSTEFEYSKKLEKNLTLFRLKTESILEEFITSKFHFKGIYKVFLDNRFVKSFLDATPGFNEFLIMSKITDLATSEEFDQVIVDAPATGHAIALLEVPQIVAKAVHSGPLKELATNTLDLIKDNKRTEIIIVTLPEEMPTSEAIFFKAKLKEIGLKSKLTLINKVEEELEIDLNDVLKGQKKVLKSLFEINSKIIKKQDKFIKELVKNFKNKTIELPFINSRDEVSVIEEISKCISKM